jgi:sulfate permease, SulP family
MLSYSLVVHDWSKSETVRGRLQDLSGGAICSVLSIAYSLSYATLIFSGPLSQWLGYGMAVTLLSASIGALVIGLRSSLPFAIAGPDSSTSAVMAAFTGAFIAETSKGGADEHLLQHAIVAIALSTALTGAVLVILGIKRAGRAIRFVPYPVIAGFLGATGWLILIGGTQLITSQQIDSLDAVFNSSMSAKLLAGATLAIALFFGQRLLRSPFVLPGLLVAGAVTVHLGLLAFGVPLAEAQANDWMFTPQPHVGLTSPWHPDELREFPWKAFAALFGDILSVTFVATITMLLNTIAIEVATEREANLDRELKWHGIANLLIAALGGYVSVTSVSRTTVNYTAGATGRLSAITVAAITAGTIVVDPSLLGYLPKCVLGGLLLYLGADLLYRWLVESSRRLAVLEYVSLLAIAFIIIRWGFVAGLLIGVVIGCTTFALSASRIPVIKFSFDGSEHHSSLDRAPEELATLADHGRELQGMRLQGYLFFGSASQLHEHTKALLAAQPGCRFLLFDLRLVTGIDSSATHSFRQIKQLADRCGARLVLVNMIPEIQNAFKITGLISGDVLVAHDLDHALEQCEDTIIKAYQASGTEAEPMREWLVQVVGAEHSRDLARECRRLEVSAGEIIAREGEPADSMHFILEGRVSITVDVGNGRKLRVRSLGRRTTVGEMGLITGQTRSATVEAEVASVLYVLKANAFERIKERNPALCQALFTYVIKVMAERLSFANRTIGALLR